jgi:hypothetical protein
MSRLEWLEYPESVPKEPAYYYTVYFNHDESKHYFKSIWWDGKDWFPWRPGGGPNLTVYEFAPQTKAPYYTESLKIVKEIENNYD